MNKTEAINKAEQEIRRDLGLLRNKHLYELEQIPGYTKCATLADRMEESFKSIIDSYEEIIEIKENATNQEHFNLLFGLLDGLAKEIADLSKKQPDGLVNSFKVGQINRVLLPLKELMTEEPSATFLDLVAEVEERTDKSRNSYSDVSVILSQYREACSKYREKYFAEWFHC